MNRTEQTIPIGGGRRLGANLVVPEHARGVVVFAHGSGSSRLSPRNVAVADTLNGARFATLLMDLLTEEEDAERAAGALRFDIALLARRLYAATEWLPLDLPVGYFGASTGAAAALIAATRRPDLVHAVVSRGGRPDLADDALMLVHAPTLLIVGQADPVVIRLNRAALARMSTRAELRIVPKATHLFEEPGALEIVAAHASEWFDRYLDPDGI